MSTEATWGQSSSKTSSSSSLSSLLQPSLSVISLFNTSSVAQPTQNNHHSNDDVGTDNDVDDDNDVDANDVDDDDKTSRLWT